MKITAILLGLCSLAVLAAAAWLAHRTAGIVHGPDYAPDHDVAGEGGGYGLYLPSWLLAGLAAFLARFAWRLWKA